jgi:hypothetical protein
VHIIVFHFIVVNVIVLQVIIKYKNSPNLSVCPERLIKLIFDSGFHRRKSRMGRSVIGWQAGAVACWSLKSAVENGLKGRQACNAHTASSCYGPRCSKLLRQYRLHAAVIHMQHSF